MVTVVSSTMVRLAVSRGPLHSVIASAATCPPKPLAKAEAIRNPSAEAVWIASSQGLLAMTERGVMASRF